MDYAEQRELYNDLVVTRDQAEVTYREACAQIERFQLAICGVAVGDIVRDTKGELKVTRVKAGWTRPDDRHQRFTRATIVGVRRKVDGTWGNREVNPWDYRWEVVARAEQPRG